MGLTGMEVKRKVEGREELKGEERGVERRGDERGEGRGLEGRGGRKERRGKER